MGNHASSCCFPVMHSSPKAKLIDGEGNVRQVDVPIKAVEVMLEVPGHLISPVDDLLRSQRISVMRADDELLAGKVYLLVRACRVNGKVTTEETAMIDAACDDEKNKKNKKISLKMRRKRSGGKVLPALNDESCSEEEDKESDDRVTVLGSGYGFWKNKQWSPVLESIPEVW